MCFMQEEKCRSQLFGDKQTRERFRGSFILFLLPTFSFIIAYGTIHEKNRH